MNTAVFYNNNESQRPGQQNLRLTKKQNTTFHTKRTTLHRDVLSGQNVKYNYANRQRKRWKQNSHNRFNFLSICFFRCVGCFSFSGWCCAGQTAQGCNDSSTNNCQSDQSQPVKRSAMILGSHFLLLRAAASAVGNSDWQSMQQPACRSLGRPSLLLRNRTTNRYRYWSGSFS